MLWPMSSILQGPSAPVLYAKGQMFDPNRGSDWSLHGMQRKLLTDDDQTALSRFALPVRFNKSQIIFKKGEPVEAAFIVARGVIGTTLPRREYELVSAFLYPGDLLGFSLESQYQNGARALTPAIAYKLPQPRLRRILADKPSPLSSLVAKLNDDLRGAEYHAFLLTQKKAEARLSLFLELQENMQSPTGEFGEEIYLPMSRSSIASYLGITLAALSRAFRIMVLQKVITCRDLHHVRILDRSALRRLSDVVLTEPA